MTLRAFLKSIARHIKATIISFIVVVVVVMSITLIIPPKYQAKTTLVVANNKNSSQIAYINSQIPTYEEAITSNLVLGPMIRELHLQQSTDKLAKEITVSNPTGTQLLVITVTDRDRQEAAVIANSIVKFLNKNIVNLTAIKHRENFPVTFKSMSKAVAPKSPVFPNYGYGIILSILLGIAVGCAVSLLLEMRRDKFDTSQEVSNVLGIQALGVLPKSKILSTKEPVLVSHGEDPRSEEIRSIATKLALSVDTKNSAKGGKTIIVTSTETGEGKTTVAVNIAAAFAEQGLRVLVIEADLRSPAMADHLLLSSDLGLSEVLLRMAPMKDVVSPYWKSNLHVLSAGKSPDNPSALLNSPFMLKIIEEARNHYDYVIIETSAMHIASDAARYASNADGVVLVVRRQLARVNDLEDTVDMLKTASVGSLGFVFNAGASTNVERRKGQHNSK